MELINDTEFISGLLKTLQNASRIAEQIRSKNADNLKITKQDLSPVTIADFCCQMIITNFLKTVQESKHLPCFHVVSEEDSQILLQNPQLARECIQALNWSFDEENAFSILQELIDYGKQPESKEGNSYWVIDPIDGTKGFLRNGHFAICIGYLQEGIPIFGALACPFTESGIIQWAIKGKGAFQASLFEKYPLSKSERIHTISPMKGEISQTILVQSFESSHSNENIIQRIVHELEIQIPPIKIDSQSKYALVSNGKAQIYIRIPRLEYREKIWDHAPGYVILKEAGGLISDFEGKELEFSKSQVKYNHGIVCSSDAFLHNEILNVIQNLKL